MESQKLLCLIEQKSRLANVQKSLAPSALPLKESKFLKANLILYNFENHQTILIMRIFPIISNFILLGFAINEFMEHDFPSTDSDNFWFAIFIVFTPLMNLFVFFSTGISKKNWLSLYLKRKALEEQKKIDQMKT